MQTYQKPGIRQETPIEVEPKKSYWKWVLAITILILLAGAAIPRSRKMLRGRVETTVEETAEALVKDESPSTAELIIVTNNTTEAVAGDVSELPKEERRKKKGKNSKWSESVSKSQ